MCPTAHSKASSNKGGYDIALMSNSRQHAHRASPLAALAGFFLSSLAFQVKRLGEKYNAKK
jgi:hypothetical protein